MRKRIATVETTVLVKRIGGGMRISVADNAQCAIGTLHRARASLGWREGVVGTRARVGHIWWTRLVSREKIEP